MAAAADDPRLSWWWQFSTNPALGGVLALVAAILAFIRIGHQVAESKRGNNEIARKNSEDQWWDTLKWTYAEAKESDAKNATFRTVAAVRILSSLNQNPDHLTVQPQRAVESILDIFGSSDLPEVQDAVAPIYQSRHESGFAFEDAVKKMLTTLNLDGAKIQRAGSHDMGFDFLIKSAQATVFIEAKAGQSTVGATAANQLLRTMARSQDPKNTAGLLISQAGLTQLGSEIIEGAPVRVKAMRWEPGMSTGEVEEVLTHLLSGPWAASVTGLGDVVTGGNARERRPPRRRGSRPLPFIQRGSGAARRQGLRSR